MFWGIVLFFAMPTSPMSAWFLNGRERKIAVFRVIQNHTGLQNRQYKLYQVLEALRDPQAWMLFANVFLQCIPGGGLTAVRSKLHMARTSHTDSGQFNKIILTGLGYSDVESTIMAMPEHAIQLVSVLLAYVLCYI